MTDPLLVFGAIAFVLAVLGAIAAVVLLIVDVRRRRRDRPAPAPIPAATVPRRELATADRFAGARVLLSYADEATTHPAHTGHEFGGAYARAAALAAGDPDWQNATGGTVVELDPLPWRTLTEATTGGLNRQRWIRTKTAAPTLRSIRSEWAPRESYEQDRAKYEAGA